MNVAIVLAGGTGERIGAGIPKQFIVIDEKPIMAYTLENLERFSQIDAIEIVCHKDWLGTVKNLCNDFRISKCKWIVEGGNSFQESVMKGIYFLKDKIEREDIAVIYFAVSPLSTEDVVNDSIRVAKEHGNGISAEDSPLCTCIKEDEQGTHKNLIRERIKGFSNPWSFKYGELVDTYDEAIKRGIIDTIEAHTTSVYLELGKRLWFSKSNGYNFKITTREDIDKFEALLLLKKTRMNNGIEVQW